MKKILQICAIDGTVKGLLMPLVKASMDIGYTVHCACTNTGKFEALRKQGLHMIEVPIERKINPLSNLKSMLKLFLLMRKEKYDIVHVHTPVASIIGRAAAKLAGIKNVIYTAHGFYFHEGMSKSRYKFFYNLEKFFARFFTDWLLLQSREDYELCKNDRFKAEERIIHLSNGVDIYNKFNPGLMDGATLKRLKKEHGINDKDVVFAFIGRLIKEKGIFELLEAFINLRNSRPNAKLLLIGGALASERDQESFSLLKGMLQEPGVIATGFREDIPELLAISDIFILPSYREGLPRSIIEAMAMGKPIIATNIRGCREEVFNGENGYLVEKASPNQLYEKMMLLVNDEHTRILFGKRSRRIVEELFDETKVIEKQLELFGEIFRSGRKPGVINGRM